MKRTLQEIFNPLLDFLVGYCTGLSLLYTNISFAMTRQDKRFTALKDTHKGQRCFIVGLGPSLTVDDLNALADHHEYTFSMNRCYQLFEKTKWRPDCYVLTDGKACTEPTMKAIDEMLADGTMVLYSKMQVHNMPDQAIWFKSRYNHFIKANSKWKHYQKQGHYCKMSPNAGTFIYDGHTCVHSIIQIAYYMGFSEVYLIGTDCSYSPGHRHAAGIATSKFALKPNDDMEKFIIDYESMQEDIDAKGLDFHIYNVTKGGALEVFPRKRLEDVLGN